MCKYLSFPPSFTLPYLPSTFLTYCLHSLFVFRVHQTYSHSTFRLLLSFCIRSSLCLAIVGIAAKQDASSSLLSTLASSLLSSFFPPEIISASGRAVCGEALQIVSSLSNEGHLTGSAQLLADLVSVFTVQGTSTTYGTYNGSGSVYNVSTAASSLVQGVQLDMAFGEVPVSLITPNVQLSVSSTLIFASSNIVLTTPATASQSAYGFIQPKVTIGPKGLQDCAASSTFAQLSVMQWSINPYAGSTAVQTPLLRLAYSKQVAESGVQSYSRVLSQVQENSASFSITGNPAYYVALQFLSVLKFNFSAIAGHQTADTRGLYNFTIPACRLYNGVEYVSCESCSISSYTDYNVTYSCFDITQLCPLSSGKRRLEEENSLSSPAQSLSYSTVIESVGAEFYDVLSSNPFKLDLTVISFMGSLSGCIIIIILYLLRKDHNEKLYKRYVKSAADNLARKLLKDEIKKGGNGDLGESYQSQVKSLNLSIKSAKSFSSTLSRTFSGRTDNHCRDRGATFLGVNFDFDEIESNEFDSDCSDDISTNEGEKSDFLFENMNSSSNSVERPEEVPRVRKNTLRADCNEDSNNGMSSNFEEAKLAEQFGTAAVVTEFLYKLFPGRSIFIREKNLWGIVGVQHTYFTMFAASTVTQTRTVRFFHVLSLVLASVFADTVFFGIYYPVDSACTFMTDKVNQI